MSFTFKECPAPFIAELPAKGGDLDSRFCAPIPGAGSCCLPCPKQNYFYPDRFSHAIHAMTFLSLVSVVACAFLLLSFVVLPTQYTNRHYLSVCLTFAILLMQVSFVIPFGNQETQCYDVITPHDMFSSINCALSGALLLGGGLSTVMWVVLRTVSLHLQICWQVVPGRKFFLSAQALGWSIPIVCLSIAMSITGVSFRFGESCHINSHKGLQTFWGPLLGLAAAAIVTQFITFVYCVRVYIRSLFEDKPGTTQLSSGSGLPYAQSTRTVTAAQALRRIRRVLALQWRGIGVVIIILIDTIYFSTVFLQFDSGTQRTPANIERARQWISCVVMSGGDKSMCYNQAQEIVLDEAYAISVLFLLSCNGLWALLLLGRPTIYGGWVDYIRSFFKQSKPQIDEFVSLNAARISGQPKSNYEIIDAKKVSITTPNPIRAPEATASSSPLREYNPSTFSAHLRERADSNLSLTTPMYSPYTDGLSRTREPSGPPFSPFKDSYSISSRSISPIDDDRKRRPSFPHAGRKASEGSVSAGPYSPYADGEISPRFPESALKGPGEGRIGFAQ